MTQAQLSQMMIIHIHKYLIDSVDHIKVLNEFVSASKGRHARTVWNILSYSRISLMYNGLLCVYIFLCTAMQCTMPSTSGKGKSI